MATIILRQVVSRAQVLSYCTGWRERVFPWPGLEICLTQPNLTVQCNPSSHLKCSGDSASTRNLSQNTFWCLAWADTEWVWQYWWRVFVNIFMLFYTFLRFWREKFWENWIFPRNELRVLLCQRQLCIKSVIHWNEIISIVQTTLNQTNCKFQAKSWTLNICSNLGRENRKVHR